MAGKKRPNAKLVPARQPKIKYRKKTVDVIGDLQIRGNVYHLVEQFPASPKQPRVYRAIGRVPRIEVAIRVRPVGSAGRPMEDLVRMFQARHGPEGISIVDSGRSETHEYLVTPWLRGRPFSTYRGYFEPYRLYELFRGLISTMTRIHAGDLIHGDIKPDNLIVTEGRPERLLPIDFGSAWWGARGSKRLIEGTRGYTAPEQWDPNQLADHRADQFSVSVVLYEALTRELPYGGFGGEAGRLPESRRPPYKPASSFEHKCWPGLDAVLEKSLSLCAADRYPTSREWRDAFKSAGPPKTAFRRWATKTYNATRYGDLLPRNRG